MKKNLLPLLGLFLIISGIGTFYNNESDKELAVGSQRTGLAKTAASGAVESSITTVSGEPAAAGESISELPADRASQLTPGMPATVTKFVDGDTTYFSTGSQELKVRYLLIDTPEIKGDQPFAAEAKARVTELLTEAQSIELEYDIGKRQDHYGRDLMYVWVNGQLVQEILAREGLCMVRYIEAPNTRYLDQVKNAEAEAKAAGRGIWSIENYAGASGFEAAGGVESQPANDEESRKVYVAPNSGSKYHFDENCRGLRNASSIQEVSENEAKRSYELCGYED